MLNQRYALKILVAFMMMALFSGYVSANMLVGSVLIPLNKGTNAVTSPVFDECRSNIAPSVCVQQGSLEIYLANCDYNYKRFSERNTDCTLSYFSSNCTHTDSFSNVEIMSQCCGFFHGIGGDLMHQKMLEKKTFDEESITSIMNAAAKTCASNH